jgi:ribose transport system permease protein
MEDTMTAPALTRTQIRRSLADRPLLVLGVVLVALVLATGLIEPGYFSVRGIRNTLLLAAPVGILAAAQTILMLTRGIDISVAMIGTLVAYVVADQTANLGVGLAIGWGLLVGALVGAVNGLVVGIFRVHPLIVTLATSAILLGLLTQWAPTIFRGATSVPGFVRTVGGGSFAGNLIPYNALIWAAVAVVVILGLRRTGLGRMVDAAGRRVPAAVGGGRGDRRDLAVRRRRIVPGHDRRGVDPERARPDAHVPGRQSGREAGRVRGHRARDGLGVRHRAAKD